MKTLELIRIVVIVCISVGLFTKPSAAETRVKVRAREHFDSVWINYKTENKTTFYRGMGPNINVWLEDAYRYSFGFAYSLLFINNPVESDLPGFGEDAELTKIGLEFKYYVIPDEGGLFSRVGISHNRLNTKGSLDSLGGVGGYLGLGWEFKFSRIGLALEAAVRRIEFEKDIRVDTFSPSLGIHFYGYI